MNQKLSKDKDYFFEIEEIKRPWYNSAGGEPDYRTIEKASFTFWLSQSKNVTLTIRDSSDKEIWKMNFNGQAGMNQFRWDLVTTKQTSDYPYFVHYEKFIEAGAYVMTISLGEENMEQRFTVVNATSPYIDK